MEDNKMYPCTSEYEKDKMNKLTRDGKLVVLARSGYNIPLHKIDFNRIGLFLIPTQSIDGKFGFVNRDGEISISPIFDDISGHFYRDSDVIKVKREGLWYVLNSKGEEIGGRGFHNIIMSPDSKFLSVQERPYKNHRIFDADNSIYIGSPKGFHQISGFYCGYSRVEENGKWGIINTKGEIIVPLEYNCIHNFVGRYDWDNVILEKEGNKVCRFDIKKGILI